MDVKKLTDYDLCYKIGQIGLNDALRTITEDDIENSRTADYWKVARMDKNRDSESSPTYSMEEAVNIINSYEGET